jgi:transcriptional regulator with XRE-family HTH domain
MASVAKKNGLLPFHQLLKEYRLAVGMSISQLAKKSGVLRGTIEMLENGKRAEPRRWTIGALAEALGVSPELFFRKKEKAR